MNNKRLIVVLGMHRSGTSAITKSLELLEVGLGANLHPPGFDNPKGFWEDRECIEINDKLLNHLGSAYNRLDLAWNEIQTDSQVSELKLKAVQLISRKLINNDIWGFKDPRTCRLLAFWNEVFSALNCEVSFVIAIRNPASVAASLATRNNIPAEKAYFLWIQHILPSLSFPKGVRSVVVDYDELLEDPYTQLIRISSKLGLPLPDRQSALVKDFENNFLESELRHTRFTEEQLSLDSRAPRIVLATYKLLQRLAKDQDYLENSNVQDSIKELNSYLRESSPVFDYINLLEDEQTRLNQAVVERDGQIGSLNQAVAEREGQIVSLNQTIAERDGQIVNLSQTIAERDGQIVNLSQLIIVLNQEVAALRNSLSWCITKPLRIMYSLLGQRHTDRKVLTQPVLALERNQSLDNLPDGFDEDLYLKLNPDLGKPGIDLKTHYLLHGRHEGRFFSLPAMDICGEHNFKVDRETILVVSHEASRTGAPVLSLNIIQAFVDQYNVVVLLLGGGSLSDAFRLTGAAIMTFSELRERTILAQLFVEQLCQRFNFKFALVNSIESRVVLPALSNCFVPTISLIHEFASYTRPRDGFRKAVLWSNDIVFSANVTLENALTEYPDLNLSDRAAHILPQGRCLLPMGEFSKEQFQAEKTRIRRLIRPKGIAKDTVIVLGAGFVQLRKGVDLFIECAARVVLAPGGEKCRFVWIGKGYDPENDLAYSVYLADQIRRAGLEKHLFFLDETPAIETAYEEADLFLLSSRLDPLPNVAIDAIASGVPVLCFNKTTGIADFLIDSGLRNHCVAEYLDSADMAEKVSTLARSQALREQVGDQCRAASILYFSMKDYIARLEKLACDVCARTQQEKVDTQVILDSGLFRSDFSCLPHGQGQAIEGAVRGYVRAWASGVGRRKPCPGFHPNIYLEQHGLVVQGTDPFADYLRAGQPEGPWNYPVIVARETREKQLPNQHVALHLHVYYPELLSEITTRLSCNRICPDLFVSITNEEDRKVVVSGLNNYKGRVIDIQLVPNRGRDIGPFLTVFGQRILASYDYVGHIHTKKSADVKDAAMGKRWYRFLLENLLGGESGAMADSILAKMKIDTSIGMVFPDEPNIIGLGANRSFAEPLAVLVGLQKLPDYFIFPVGTMFWAKTSALAPLIDLKLDWDDYPEEPLAYDGTLLHAIERLFPLILAPQKMRCATTNVIGLTR